MSGGIPLWVEAIVAALLVLSGYVRCRLGSRLPAPE